MPSQSGVSSNISSHQGDSDLPGRHRLPKNTNILIEADVWTITQQILRLQEWAH